MSYIDTIDHEFLAFFGGLPVYHPLETIPLSYNQDNFGCNPNQIIIGGGGGEHPALICLNPEAAVAYFITSWISQFHFNCETQLQTKDPDMEFVKAHIEKHGGNFKIWDKHINSHFGNDDVVSFAGWRTKNYHSFYNRCTSDKMNTPFNEKEGSIESWVASNFGEFIFFSLPEMVRDIEDRLPGVKESIRDSVYMNFLIPPPGYPNYNGGIMKGGQRIYGLSRW